MGKAIEQLDSGLTVGHAGLGLYGDHVGSVKQQVHDGDTVTTRGIGNLPVRLLGVDAPEISYNLPALGETLWFVPIKDKRWTDFLTDPFGQAWEEMPPLDERLDDYLRPRFTSGTAPNHAALAEAAQRKLEALIESDQAAQGVPKDDFRFFLAFASEVMDRYGRLLAYLNCDEPNASVRPLSYNERLLEAGAVLPYFIWPNVDPFRKQLGLVAAALPPGRLQDEAQKGALGKARTAVKAARQRKDGIWAGGCLILEAFELRYLAGRRPPDRWLIDLSKTDSVLIQPQRYPDVPQPEDRLWIPPEYVPLFVENGWHRQV